MMSELKVIVTMFVSESWKNTTEEIIMTHPWKMDFQTQIKNVFIESTRPFCKLEYKIGNFMTADSEQSSSVTSENTGNIV
jgi:hypothetical protein